MLVIIIVTSYNSLQPDRVDVDAVQCLLFTNGIDWDPLQPNQPSEQNNREGEWVLTGTEQEV